MIAIEKFTNRTFTVTRGEHYPYVINKYIHVWRKGREEFIDLPMTRDEFTARFKIVGDGDEPVTRLPERS